MKWTDLDAVTLASPSKDLKTRNVSALNVTEACLDRIERFNGRLNAFITLTPERALDDARRADREMKRGVRRGPLHGVPIAIKDNMATRGIRTTGGSRVLNAWIPAWRYSADLSNHENAAEFFEAVDRITRWIEANI